MSARTLLSIPLLSLACLTANCGGDGEETAGTTTGADVTVNGCTKATAADHTADAVTTISFADASTLYVPKCVKIAAGNSVTFSGSFTAHPLAGGTASSTSKMQDPASPIPFTASGDTVTVAFPDAGDFGFYCNIHGTVGMLGAVFVE